MRTTRAQCCLWSILCVLLYPQLAQAQATESIFTTEVPGTYANDAFYELGTRFKALSGGQITGVRIYTGTDEGGEHTVRIWNDTGAVVAGPFTWTIPSGSAGWKIFYLPVPLTIAPHTDYTVSVSNSSDHWYSSTAGGFSSPVNSMHLVTYTGSGVFSTVAGTRPTSVSGNRNYFRDVLFVSSDTSGNGGIDTNGVSIWPLTAVPANNNANDNAAVELGLKFKPRINGKITGVRYYKSSANNGTHTGSLWSASGVLLAQAVFTSETDSGWQQVTFSSPVTVQAGKTYVVSYHTNSGHYAYDYHYFDSAHHSPYLTALAGAGIGGNGVFAYSQAITFPMATSNATNYWVDVTFDPGGLDSSAVSIWPLSTVPANDDAQEGAAVELGLKFIPDTNGRVTGVRFYKSFANTGTHVGSLWDAEGQLLRQGTFREESASGWQELSFDRPVKVRAGKMYVVSYHTNTGHYAYQYHYFDSSYTSGHLKAPGNGQIQGNGVYKYSATPAFPVGASSASNYWVDVTFTTAKPEDSIAPTRPLNVFVDGSNHSTISLAWTHSNDNVGVTGYHIYRNGSAQPVAVVTGNHYTDLQLAPGSTYTYVVRAVDYAENLSDPSDMVTVTTTGVAAGANRALQFDGVDDCIALYNDLNLPQNDFTFETWVKVMPGGSGVVYGNYEPIQVRVAQNEVLLSTKLGSLSALTDDNSTGWVYFAFTREGNTLTAYRNGQFLKSVALSPGTIDFTQAGIGGIPQDHGTSTHNFKGAIDEIRISRTARTAAEILTNWNGGNGRLLLADAATAALWHFNEGKGKIVYDFSDYGHEGQLRPAFPANNADWISGAYVPGNNADFVTFTPDFHSRIGVRPLVAVSGASSSDVFKASLDGTVVFQQAGSLPLTLRFPVSLRTLQAGDHTFTWELLTNDGILIKRDSTVFNKPVSGIPRSAIDEDNAPCVDGERIPFVFAPFIANKDWVEDAHAGWLTYSPLAINTFFSKGYSHRSVDFTKWAWDNHQLYSIQGDDTANIALYVDSLKDLPGLLMYTWMDEPDLAGVPSAKVRAWTDTTHMLDHQHPVVINLQGASAEREDALYWIHSARSFGYPRHTADVMMFDYYPKAMASEYVENINLEQAFANLATVCDNYRYWTYDQEPVWSFVQPNRFADTITSAPAPTVSELRANYWINIIHGVKGIGWFPHHLRTPDSNFAEMSRLVDKTIRLTDVIYSPELEDAVVKKELSGGRIDISVKKHDGKLYIIALNMKNAPQDCSFKLNVPATGNAAVVFDENRNIALSGAAFTDHFDPYEEHIYTITDSATTADLARSGPAAADENTVGKDGIMVAPNPFSTALRVSVEPGTEIRSIDIVDAQGRLQMTVTPPAGSAAFSIEPRALTRGMYLFRFHTNKGIKTKKLIKL